MTPTATTHKPNVGDFKIDNDTGQAFVWNGTWIEVASGLTAPMVITVNKRITDAAALMKAIIRARDIVAKKNRMAELHVTYDQFNMLIGHVGGTWMTAANQPVSGTLFGMNVKVV